MLQQIESDMAEEDKRGRQHASVLQTTVYHVSLAYNLVMNKLTSRTWWTRITDHVILGALPLHGRNHHTMLKSEGVVAVVTMNEPFELEKTVLGTPVTPDEWSALGIDQCIGTTQDFTPPELDTLIRCVNFVQRHVNQGGTVYVHCKAGRGRSTLVVAAYLMQTNKWTIDQAFEFIQAKRSHIAVQKRKLVDFQRYLDSTDRA
ncbi:unnamed protein product [Aphanomyces euteiches]|nr:hypothetical protein AeMF1_015578 [Aphanomyces euteiches]KAH9148795.1 hypothetical protein AeRB84_007980 [Aphanomyces euteiches]KAH9149727.1 hypothetical protein LEN26_004169 [Aphanomyces euteiches]KAH9191310.1 hypothetical protein AeNC1_006721 [Aphanomyces euteiches]